jgi:hypothetical protein
MTDKITLATVGSLQDTTTAANTINNNFAIIQAAMDNTLSRDGTAPDQMENNLDMNSFQILNLPVPATVDSPARLQDVIPGASLTVPPVGTSGAVVGLLNTNKTDSGNDTFTGTTTFDGIVAFNGGVSFPANTIQTNEIAQIPSNTLLGNNTGSTGNIQELTPAQVSAMIGLGWTNVSSIKTSAYTAVPSDTGLTLALGGSAFFTLSFGAPASYPSTFVVMVLNTDAGRGKTISPSGSPSFILWPGQSCFVFNQGGTWYVFPSTNRWKKTGVVLFVDASNGNDANDGLVAGTGAFATISAAVLALYQQMDCNNAEPVINVAGGTFTESVSIAGQLTGSNVLNLVGPGSASSSWQPGSGGFNLLVSDNAEVILSGFTLTGPGSSGAIAVSTHQTAVLDLGPDLVFGSYSGGIHISMDHGGFINAENTYTISGPATTHVNLGPGAQFQMSGGQSVVTAGSPAIGVFYRAVNAGITFAGLVGFSGAPSGVQQYSIDFNGFFSSSGSGIPGSAGVTAHGGVFA